METGCVVKLQPFCYNKGVEILKTGGVVLLLFAAVYTDIKKGKIYNKMTFPGMAFGLAINSIHAGPEGAKWSLAGWAVAFGFFFLPYIMGGLKAGDIKLLCAIGSMKGPAFAFFSCLATAVAGGLVASVILMKRRALVSEAGKMGQEFVNFVFFKVPMRLDEGKSSAFPYGAAIAAGTFAVLISELFFTLPARLHGK